MSTTTKVTATKNAQKLTYAEAATAYDILTGSYNDQITGSAFDDLIKAGAGNDHVSGGKGNDSIDGGSGSDQLFGDEGQDTLKGGDGLDTLRGGDGNDSLDGGTSSDQLSGEAGADALVGGAGNDSLDGGDDNDTLRGDAGSDTLVGGTGSDSLDGGNDADVLDGGEGADTLLGGAGNDSLDGGFGADSLAGGASNDTLVGGDGADTLMGEAGNDTLYAGTTEDDTEDTVGNLLDGGANDDKLYGAAGADTLQAGTGNDLLSAGAGNDIVRGGAGRDTLTGGDGNDQFAFDAADSTSSARDIVTDFVGARSENADAYNRDLMDLQSLLADKDLAWGGTKATTNGVWYEVSADKKVTTVYVDLDGKTTSRELAITLDGARVLSNADFLGVINQAAVAVADANATNEVVSDEDKPTTTLTGNVLANDTDDAKSGISRTNDGLRVLDAKMGDKAVTLDEAYETGYGTLTLKADGSYEYVLNNSSVEYLAAGEKLLETFSYRAVDEADQKSEFVNLVITVTGTNDAPVIDAENAVVEGDITEGDTATLSDSGSITFTDVDLTDRAAATEQTKTVTAVKANGTTSLELTPEQKAAIEAAFSIENAKGNTNDGTATWKYDIAETALNFLAEGEKVTAVFTITVDDDNEGVATQDVTITLTGTNDAPVLKVVDVEGALTEGTGSGTPETLTDIGSFTFTDLDLTDRAQATVTDKVIDTTVELTEAQTIAIKAAFSIDNVEANTNNGTVNWTYSIKEADLDFLAAGETVEAKFTVTVNDKNGGEVEQEVVVTLTGTNDKPVLKATDVTGAILEGKDNAETLRDSGSFSFTDVDLTDVALVTLKTTTVTALESDGKKAFDLTENQLDAIKAAFDWAPADSNANNGTVNWTYDIAETEVDFLAAGEKVTAVFTLQVDDKHGGVVTQDVTITLTGTNDKSEGELTLTASYRDPEGNDTSRPYGDSPQQFDTLTITDEVTDKDGITEGTHQYTWYRDGVAIASVDEEGGVQTGLTYQLTQADVGKTITAKLTYEDGGVVVENATVTTLVEVVETDRGAPVQNVEESGTFTVNITGTAKQGETLTASVTDASDPDGLNEPPTLSYKWFADGEEINGATGSTLRLTHEHSGAVIRVDVTMTDALGGTTELDSVETDFVVNVAPIVVSITDDVTDADNVANLADGDVVFTVKLSEPVRTKTGENAEGDATFADGLAQAAISVVGGGIAKVEAAQGEANTYRVTVTPDAGFNAGTIKLTVDEALLYDIKRKVDGGDPGTGTEVAEQDYNTLAPSFSSGVSQTVNENTTQLYDAAATDVDASDSKVADNVTFSLKGDGSTDDAELLSIDPETGGVTLESGDALNHEGKGAYSFTVVATDDAGNTTDRAVSVSVKNLDEVAPTISSAATASINENEGAGKEVYTVTATDHEDTSAGVTFSLSGADANRFTINANTGKVHLKDNPDREAKSTYDFVVEASDGVNATVKKDVTLAINDVNEAPTAITLNDPVNIIENATVGAGIVVGTLAVTDPDGNKFGDNELTVDSDGDGRFFSVVDGQLVYSGPAANFEAQSAYEVRVIANDGVGELQKSQSFVVDVTNVNEAVTGVDDTATAKEAGGVNNGTAGTNPTGNLLKNDTDVDGNGNARVVTKVEQGTTVKDVPGTGAVSLVGQYGTLSISSDGAYIYQVNNADSTVQALNTGSTGLKDTFIYSVSDTDVVQGGTNTTSSSATLTVTINGANDAAVISPVTFNPTGLSLTVTDVDSAVSAALGEQALTIGADGKISLTFEAQPALTVSSLTVTEAGQLATQVLNVVVGTGTAETFSSHTPSSGIYTFAGDDMVYGLKSGSTFYLSGGAGNDVLDGRDGPDTLVGGEGFDMLFGADGTDTYVFANGDASALGITATNFTTSQVERISYYERGVDTLVFDANLAVANTGLVNGNDYSGIQAHQVENGVIRFSSSSSGFSEVLISNPQALDNAIDYLAVNDLGDAGSTVVFDSFTGAFVYNQTAGGASGGIVMLTNFDANSLTVADGKVTVY
jgi:VCBS repeat-containing protein